MAPPARRTVRRLDPTAARHLFSLVKQLHRDLGVTVLLVEHHVRAVLEHCDLIYVLNHGTRRDLGVPGGEMRRRDA